MNALLWFLRSFRKLQWRLTLSYLLVTLVVVFAVEIVNTVTDTATITRSDQPDTFAQSLGDVVIPQLAPYLSANPPDANALSKWATFFIAPPSPTKQSASEKAPGRYLLVVILNHDGQVIASAPDDTNIMQKLFLNQQSQEMVQTALQSSPQTVRVRAQAKQISIALPIKGLGVFFTVFAGPVPQPVVVAKGSFPHAPLGKPQRRVSAAGAGGRHRPSCGDARFAWHSATAAPDHPGGGRLEPGQLQRQDAGQLA